MVVRETIKNVKHPVTVAVTTSAEGPAAQWIWSDTIAPEDFRKAIIMSLEKSGLFKAITTDDASDYILNAKLNYVSSHPGFAMHAWVNIAWTLTKRATGDVIWTSEIDTGGDAGVGDTFFGAKRQFIAMERGAKENIEQALKELQKLDL